MNRFLIVVLMLIGCNYVYAEDISLSVNKDGKEVLCIKRDGSIISNGEVIGTNRDAADTIWVNYSIYTKEPYVKNPPKNPEKTTAIYVSYEDTTQSSKQIGDGLYK